MQEREPKNLPEDDPRHGVRGYNLKCRCEICKAAQRIRTKRYIETHAAWKKETNRNYAAANAARTMAEVNAMRDKLHPDGTKKCRSCNTVKEFESFRKDTSRPDGISNKCIDCGDNPRTGQYQYLLEYWSENGVDGSICYLCDQPAKHADHVYPTSRGGPNEKWNMLPACVGHNLEKKARLPEEYFLFLIESAQQRNESAAKVQAALLWYRTILLPQLINIGL